MWNNRTLRKRHCVHCGGTVDAELVRRVISNGATQAFHLCLQCNNYTESPPIWLSHRTLPDGLTLDDLRITEVIAAEWPCAVCGSPHAELHHWAPQAAHYFGEEAHKWPTSYLCRDCHARWHRIVTPDLVAPRAAKTVAS